MNQTATATTVADEDPQRYFWYGVWALVMVLSALPMLGLVTIPRIMGYTATLIVHELSAFLYFGHTFFSNIWALLIRKTQPVEVGIWARALLRKLCLGVTATTAVITPLFGVMLLDDWGGLTNVPWAWDGYFAFWLMAGFSIVPDVIRYARNRNAADPKHGLMSGGIRGMLALVATLYILVYCMIAKGSLFHGPILGALGISSGE